MNKLYILGIIFFLLMGKCIAQASSEAVAISETYSANGKFKLRSVSFDNEFPNLRGESVVSHTDVYTSIGKRKTFYKINRSFDLWLDWPLFAAISNDGRKILYMANTVYDKGDENKNVTYYVDGKLSASYTTEEFTGCSRRKEKCGLMYDNNFQIIKAERSSYLEYKDDVTEKDKFLSRNYVFNKNDTVYLIDSRKKCTLFDLHNNRILANHVDFDSLYPAIRQIEAVKSRITFYQYPFTEITSLENEESGEKLSEAISRMSGLKYIGLSDSTFRKFKLFRIQLTGYLSRDGSFDIDRFEADSVFNRNQVREYLLTSKFRTGFIPKEVDKIYLKSFFGGYRSHDEKIALRDTEKDKEARQLEYQQRLTLDSIEGIYIPGNLQDALISLDSLIDFEGKKALKTAEGIFSFNSHMGGLGMWIRNNWGINGGSRLLKYFHDRGIKKNEEISGIIIQQYVLWLNGDRSAWTTWEKTNPETGK